jgi:hypothetical protein
MKQLIFLIFTTLLLTTIATAEITTAEEGTVDETLQITLVDIYTGDTKKSSGCIFKVNGVTGVVDYRDTEIINGVSIYVQEVYAVNTEAKDKDNCAFLYYLVAAPKEEESGELEIDESMDVNTIQVGDEEVEFLLSSRDAYNAMVEDTNTGEYIEVEIKSSEETRITINGIDVTGTNEKDNTNEGIIKPSEPTKTNEEPEIKKSRNGFFVWVWDIFFK